MSSEIKRLQLWGDTAVGKTMLLAAAFGDTITRMSAFPNIDFRHDETNLAEFERHYARMRRGAHLGGTTHTRNLDELMFRVALKGTGEIVGVRDIQGRMWEEFSNIERNQLARDTHATLFVISWDSAQLARRLNAVGTLLPNIEHQADQGCTGLVFTQFDRARVLNSGKREFQELLVAPAWKRDPVVQGLNSFLELEHNAGFFEKWFGPRIWLTSAWGYAGAAKQYSASVLSDFGDCLPCHIEPRNVTTPFSAMFAALSPGQ